jgi:hypothetical protein
MAGGAQRVIMTALARLGYQVTELIDMGTGLHWLELR